MRTIFLASLLLFVTSAVMAGEEGRCSFGEGTVIRQIAGFQIKIAPYRDKDNPDFPQCRAKVRSKGGKIIFSEHDSGFSVALAGEDVNGDGAPDVVLEAYSGGAHCCWTYYIISLGDKPGVLRGFENQLPARFERNQKTGRIEIATADGGFDYFDGSCHPCSPFPRVYLRMDGRLLVDVSAEHLAEYDEMISRTRKELTPAELQRLQALKENPTDTEGMSIVVRSVLTIVVAYLYSGREEQAHQDLQNMWPPFDQDRMWKLILETRQNGILSFTRLSIPNS